MKTTRTNTKRPKRIRRRTMREAWMVLKDRLALKELMKMLRITQRDLADAAGWKSHGMVGHLLAGRKETVSPVSAFLIAQRLGVPTSALFVERVSKSSSRAVRKHQAA